MNKEDIEFIENQIGYRFKNVDLLIQAFTRKSYSIENGGADNEVLEFIGDRVLGFIVVKLLTEEFNDSDDKYQNSFFVDTNRHQGEYISSLSEGELTEIKKKLVKKNTLADAIYNLDIENYLIMGIGDIKNNVQESNSVKEDLFEAIIGAIALDSNWNISEIEDVVGIMLNPDEIIYCDDINYIAEVQSWSLRNYGKVSYYSFFSNVNRLNSWGTNDAYECRLSLSGVRKVFKKCGRSKSLARKNVAKMAYEYLEDNDMLFSIRDEIENPSRHMAINQLETLSRRGYFSLPTYDFAQEYDYDGNPIWKCECYIDEQEYSYWATSSSKKVAKKDAAWSMLKDVLDIADNE